MTLGEIMWEATLIGLGLMLLAGFLWVLGAIGTQIVLWSERYLDRMETKAREAHERDLWMQNVRKALVEDAHRATAGLVVDDPEPPIMTLTPERLDMLSRALAS